MPAPRKPAAASKAAAARRETAAAKQAKQPKTHEVAGITLTLADELPPEILFDMIEAEASEGAGANDYLMNLRLLRSIVGPDQFMLVRHRIGGEPEQVMELIDALLGQYGLSMGESEASPSS